MEALKSLHESVEKIVRARHGEIVDRAIRLASISCPNCDLPDNWDVFRSLLLSYTRKKLAMHRLQRSMRYAPFAHWCGEPDDPVTSTDSVAYARLEKSAHDTRNLLKAYWPCQDCLAELNPTGKKKYNSTNRPKGRSLLEND